MWEIQRFTTVYMAGSVVREGLCGRASDLCGSMWPSKWFLMIYVAKSLVREGLCDRVSGS